MMNQIGRDLDPVTKSQTKEMMEKHHVKQMTQTKLKEVHENYFIVEKENQEYYFVGTADCKVAGALGLQR